jgi:hypothetical protein
MGLLKPREERRKVFVRARMRGEHGWSDVTIGNVSSRGLMVDCGEPQRRNSFVEVRHRNVCIVGRIVWVGGSRCGVRTQDAIDLDELLSQAPPRRRCPNGDRRSVPRRPVTRPPSVAERAEASRRFARVFDWTIMVAAAGAAGAFMAQTAWSVLDTPLAQVGTALAGQR